MACTHFASVPKRQLFAMGGAILSHSGDTDTPEHQPNGWRGNGTSREWSYWRQHATNATSQENILHGSMKYCTKVYCQLGQKLPREKQQ